jgi:ribosomal protein L11 methyltransferase
MLQQMQSINFINKTVLDFGTGTGILAILAKKLGAKKVVAIDNDEWSINNARENFVANNCTDIILLQKDRISDPDSNQDEKFDIILANINLNVITSSIKDLKNISHQSSKLLLSGFLSPDKQTLINSFISEGFKYIETTEKNEWISMLLTKS